MFAYSHPMMSITRVLVFTLTGLTACADEPDHRGAHDSVAEAPPGWIAGLAYIAAPDPYVGNVDDASTVVPLMGYVGERLTWIGPSLEYTVAEIGPLELALQASYRFEGFDSDSLLGLELERRRGSLDIGVAAEYGPFFLDVVADSSGTHNGTQVTFGGALAFNVTDRLSVSPGLSATYKSAELANYYYGVSRNEATVLRPAYAPGDSVNVRAGFELTYTINPRVLLTFGVDVDRLDGRLRDSPVIGRDVQWSALAGVLIDIF